MKELLLEIFGWLGYLERPSVLLQLGLVIAVVLLTRRAQRRRWLQPLPLRAYAPVGILTLALGWGVLAGLGLPQGLASLLEKPKVRDRMAESGVRYIVWVDGLTRETDSGGSISCAVGPGGGGCIGFGWWEKESDYDAVVWDLREAKTAGSVSANVIGTSALVGVIVPLPFIARVQGTACDRLAEQLRGFLRAGSVGPG